MPRYLEALRSIPVVYQMVSDRLKIDSSFVNRLAFVSAGLTVVSRSSAHVANLSGRASDLCSGLFVNNLGLSTGTAKLAVTVIRGAALMLVGWKTTRVAMAHCICASSIKSKYYHLCDWVSGDPIPSLVRKINNCTDTRAKEFTVTLVPLEKDGMTFYAYELVDKNIETSDKRCMLTVGGALTIPEGKGMFAFAQRNKKLGFKRTLILCPPSVGFSGGMPNRENMGKAVDAALCYLEEKKEVTDIGLYGWCLGAAIIAQGISLHNFLKSNSSRYIRISDRSFGSKDLAVNSAVKLNIKKFIGIKFLARQLGKLAGRFTRAVSGRFDILRAEKKLEKHKIPHFVVTCSNVGNGKIEKFAKNFRFVSDGILNGRSSLGKTLKDNNYKPSDRLRFYVSQTRRHGGPTPCSKQIKKQINKIWSPSTKSKR